ncbi:hypothetical protein [Streptomyces sp. BPTC-684]|uniref:hypothetical protein n=1 Tax=Streptomyces sp. BPTC-684 TaxID=3043734 RepID=UPI0024B18CA1|nr:hypothetical protein [Streptomyces sp. BPTC-684]WHM40629.1 hypothetical protein QIY60_29665 [Streptomyces sp. BPTC-684]
MRRAARAAGTTHKVLPIGEQLDDWQAAIACAATLPGVDPAGLAIWGFSLSGC